MRLTTVAEAACHLKKSEAALRQDLHRGIYPYYKLGHSRNARVMLDLDEIEHHVRQYRVPAQSENETERLARELEALEADIGTWSPELSLRIDALVDRLTEIGYFDTGKMSGSEDDQ